MNRRVLAYNFVLFGIFAVACNSLKVSYGGTGDYPGSNDPPIPDIMMDLDPHGPDPFGILDISSLYGPGAWSAWLLTMFCTHFGGSSLNFVSYILYPVIATTDILVRYRRIIHQGDGFVTEKELGALAAAYVITWSSVMHTMFIFTLEPLKATGNLWRPKGVPKTWRPTELEITKKSIHATIALFPALLAMIVFGSADIFTFNSEQSNPRVLFTLSTVAQFQKLLGGRPGHREIPFPDFMLWGIFPLVPTIMALISYILRRSKIGNVACHISMMLAGWICCMYFLSICCSLVMPKSKFRSRYLPYTHHSLFDLDQFVALLLGLLAFWWEFKLVLIKLPKLTYQRLINFWRSYHTKGYGGNPV